MVSLEQARQLIADHVHLLPAERVELGKAHGRLLRQAVAATEDIPAFSRSAFDGYAVKARSVEQALRCTFEVAAGESASRSIAEGECARIFTGAPIPAGATAVAMQEHCRTEGGLVLIPPIVNGDGVRYRGEDCRAGTLLLSAGLRLGPVEVSLLAQVGVVSPLVSTRPRIVHIRTGDEVVAPDVEPGPGQIRDSNSSLLAALIAQAGGELVGTFAVGDSAEELAVACNHVEDYDLLLISGGASVGDYDFGKRVLAEQGFALRFTAVNLRPGKPLVFAMRGRRAAFVIPGNPLSHFVCWHVVIQAAIEAMVRGAAMLSLAEVELCESGLAGHARETWWPAEIKVSGGRIFAKPLKWQSSGDLTGLPGIRALLRVPSASAGYCAGGIVQALLL